MLTMFSGPRMSKRSNRPVLLLGAFVFSTLPLGTSSQETKLPGADDVRVLQTKFRQERDTVVKTGAAKRFLPILLEKAEEFGKRADAALDAGRFLQASQLFRQARW